MINNKLLVSVIMGIYNIPSKEILEKSINSILNQTYRNIEFIIIDDGSENETYEWAEEIVKNDKRVKLFKNKKNIGLTKTLNKCIELSTGDIIARMDGDDESLNTRIERQLEFLIANPEYELVACNISKFDNNGIWGDRIMPEQISKTDFLFTSPIIHPTILTYRESLKKVNYYRECWETNRNEDYDLFMRMYAEGVKMYTIQEKLYNYREDEICYGKRKYKYRINELVVRAKGFKILKLYPKAIVYVIKPLIVGLIPQKILKKMR